MTSMVATSMDIAVTRTSRRWASHPPGGLDTLNTSAIYPGEGPWSIPRLRGSQAIPGALRAWNSRHAHEHPRSDAAMHFFLDDYRFETTWSRPGQTLRRAIAARWMLTPDFSLWPAMPLAMQLWQVYRARWLGAHWEAHGVTVTPTVGWSTPESYAFAWAGIPADSVVALSTVGCRADEFRPGYEAMRETLQPSGILCYGRSLGDFMSEVITYPTRWR